MLVLSGDVPLITEETIARVRDFHLANSAAMTILTAEPAILPAMDVSFASIGKWRLRLTKSSASWSRRLCADNQSEQREINSGIYAFATAPLYAQIGKLDDRQRPRRVLPDRRRYASEQGRTRRCWLCAPTDSNEVLGVNTRLELAELDAKLRAKKAGELMLAGTTIFRPETCDIDSDVEIGTDTVIEPFVQLIGKTKIGADCRIRSYSVITNCEIGDKVLIKPGCILEDSVIRSGAELGPYSHLRPGSDIGEGAHVGNFVETKKSKTRQRLESQSPQLSRRRSKLARA